MHTLTAVQPDGIRVIHHHAEDIHGRAVCDGKEAGEDGVIVGGDTWVVVVRLHDRVVARVEVEVDGGSFGGGDGLRREDQVAVADVDVVGGGGAGTGGGRGGAAAAAGGGAALGGDELGRGEEEGDGEEGEHFRS